MGSEEKLTKVENSIHALKEKAIQLKEDSKVAATDASKVESLITVASEVISAVNECNQRFQDYKESLS